MRCNMDPPIVDPLAKVREKYPPGTNVLVVDKLVEPELIDDLNRTFGWSIAYYCVGGKGTRKAQAAAEAIRSGRHVLVLGSTGHYGHKHDRLLVNAARFARVPYVRINRGRLGIIVVAIMRSMGL